MHQLYICPSNATYPSTWHAYKGKYTNTSNHIVMCNYEHNTYTLQTTIHHMAIDPSTNKTATLHMHVPLHFYCSLHIWHIYIQKQELLHFFPILLPYMCQQYICPSNVTYASHANNSMCINGQSMPIYMQHMRSMASYMWPKHFTHDDNNKSNNDNFLIA